MKIQSYFRGSGRAAAAIERALQVVAIRHRGSYDFLAPIFLERSANFSQELKKADPSSKKILFIATPHGLHAENILQGVEAGFDAIACEKPSCVSVEEVKKLQSVKIPVAIFHGYRVMWGVQALKKEMASGRLGKIFSVEGHYLQSSTATRSLEAPSAPGWKDDIKLSGPSDVLFDIGSHWVDSLYYLLGSLPKKLSAERFFDNSPTSHRDSHVYFSADFESGSRARATFSKNVHGAQNDLEFRIYGTAGSVTWSFLRPDEIILGRGADRSLVVRKDSSLGSGQSAFHGLGWLEGYVEVINRLVQDVDSPKSATSSGYASDNSYPRLSESLLLMKSLLSII